MKIHHIRTYNLSSLYGEFTVDLDDLLGGASLFLIYGPTGSGKSTLMDAVSLALFGQTPRLDDKNGVESSKPHAIMSRGTGMCSASVQFSKLTSAGRQTYRATWSCHRARKKAGQKPQKASRSLDVLADGEWQLLVSSTKSKEYKQVFDKVLEGFSVQDFNRSMLLAQGQFDAFLGAPPKERAEILERLTDTSIYQRVGERAAAVHRRHERRLVALRTLAAADSGLSDQEFAELKVAHALNVAEVELCAEVHRRNLGSLGWLERALELHAQLKLVMSQRGQLQERRSVAEQQLARLAEHERCEQKKAFASLRDLDHATERAGAAQARLLKVEEGLPGLLKAETLAHGRAQGLSAVSERAERDLERLRPIVSLAERSSEDLKSILARERSAQVELKRAERLVFEGGLATKAASIAAVAARESAQDAQRDVEEHVADAHLLDSWAPLRARLLRLSEAVRQASSRELELAENERLFRSQQLGLSQDLELFRSSESATLEPLARSQQACHRRLSALLDGADPQQARAGLAAQISSCRSRAEAVQRAVAPAANVLRAAIDLEQLRDQVALRHDLCVSVGAEVSATAGSVERAEQAVARDATAHDRVVEVAALVGPRSALVDGVPCPLCGSEDHPWSVDAQRVADDRVVRDHLAASALALETSRSRLIDAQRGHSAARDLVGQHNATLTLLRGQQERATTALNELRGARDRALLAAGVTLDGGVERTDAVLEDVVKRAIDVVRGDVDRAESALGVLDEARRQNHDAQEATREAKEARTRVSVALDRRQAALVERGAALRRDMGALQQDQTSASAERVACAARAAELGLTVVGDDPDVWRATGEERCVAQRLRAAALVRASGVASAAESRLQGALQVARDRTAARELRLDERDALHGQAQDMSDRSRASMSELMELWREVLASDAERTHDGARGRGPGELLRAQMTWREGAKIAADRATAAHHKSVLASQAGLQEQQGLTAERKKLTASMESAREELTAVVQALDLASDGALLSARLGEPELVESRSLRASLHAEGVQVETRLAERSQRAQEHDADRPERLADDPVLDQIKGQVELSERGLESASLRRQQTGDRVRDHHTALDKRSKARARLHEAEADARVWHTLHNYIGKNDGGKFKQFAQALNLGQLLDKANVHLRRLSDRYQLVPHVEDGLPTLEFDLCDLWQAGVRVSPRSLSGGERFLVSLSLALGLSDFRSVKMPIETLLLDEGFGTLDAATLSTALAALSQLQADGRQVGIISHVVGLHERIAVTIEVRPLGGGRSEVVTS